MRYGGNFDVDILFRYGEFRRGGLQQGPFKEIWTPDAQPDSFQVSGINSTCVAYLFDKCLKHVQGYFCISLSAISAYKILAVQRILVN
jgi:hypothetical protein